MTTICMTLVIFRQHHLNLMFKNNHEHDLSIMCCTQNDRQTAMSNISHWTFSQLSTEHCRQQPNNQILLFFPLIQAPETCLATCPSMQCLNRNEPITKSSLTWDHVILSANNHPLPPGNKTTAATEDKSMSAGQFLQENSLCATRDIYWSG